MRVRSYLSSVLDGMAKGLFSSLIIGVILKQIGSITELRYLTAIGQIAQYLMGPCIGLGIAFAREARQFTLLSSLIVGALGAGAIQLTETNVFTITTGEPVGAFAAALIGVEIGRRIEGHTKFDLFIVPGAVILIGGAFGVWISPILSEALNQMGFMINEFTSLQPLPMGVLLGVIVGMILTLPISSAALCISIGINGIAAGAALAGCCAQMVGFAVMGFRENKLGGLLSQGLGTSMLQMPNIIKNPRIWIPPTLTGGFCGALSTTVFQIESTSVGAGMGTSGLVGQFATYSVMGPRALGSMILLHFCIPAVCCFIGGEWMRRKNWIGFDDLKL